MRICSLLPSATEILFALGLGEQVVGVTHECDFPPEARHKPRVIQSVINHDAQSSEQIDRFVRGSLRSRKSLYRLDEPCLQRLAPDLVVTQELCNVCAIDTTDVVRSLASLPSHPAIISLHAHTITEALEDILLIGQATARAADATRLVASLRARIAHVREVSSEATTIPRVFCLEWLDPLMASGHWVPEMVELAGGQEVLGKKGEPSRCVSWEEIIAAQPEVVIIMPCGFPIARTKQELPGLASRPGWKELPAVRSKQVYLVNGPAYFNQSGPRLVDGLEILAGLLHPHHADLIPDGAAEPWNASD